MNIAQNLEKPARLHPERTALVFEGATWTYAQLEKKSARFAAALRAMGIGPGDRVGLFLPNIPAFVIAYYGTLKLGALAVSVNARSTATEVRFVLDDCGAKVLVTTAAMRASIPEKDLPSLEKIIVAEGEAGNDIALDGLIADSGEELVSVDRDRSEAAVILYTSGTTGTPKGATLSHGNVVSNAWSFVHHCGMTRDDRIQLHQPLFHCYAQNALLNSGLLAGSTLVLQRGFGPDTALEAIEQNGITMLFAVPTMFLAMLEQAEPEKIKSVRYYFSAAASLPAETEQRWREKFGRVVTQGYGLTETSPFASYNGVDNYRHGSLGLPIENVEMKVLHTTTGAEVPPGELGEIVIKGPNVMLGYWNRPEETAQALRGGWFHSGDIGKTDEDGYFYMADRLKDMVDVGGMNVYPVEVENALYAHEAVAEVAVFGVPDNLMGEQVWAHVVLKEGAAPDQDELVKFCQARLADFKTPRVIEFVTELPKNPSGKILKHVLREKARAARATTQTAAIAGEYHATEASGRRAFLTEYLRVRLAPALGLELKQVDPAEPLTDLGLESLKAVDLTVQIRNQLGVELSAVVFFGGNSIDTVAGILAATLDKAQPPNT
ncbi:MAG: long-chain-fatty-acid--CoA ligase [Spartobacteria bacterium]